jgi:hypothetical protein
MKQAALKGRASGRTTLARAFRISVHLSELPRPAFGRAVGYLRPSPPETGTSFTLSFFKRCHGMTPSRRRWFHYGEPWGLLAKVNRKATISSVAWHALQQAIFGLLLCGIAVYLGFMTTEFLIAKLLVSSLLLAFIGGLMEWQIGDIDDDISQ